MSPAHPSVRATHGSQPWISTQPASIILSGSKHTARPTAHRAPAPRRALVIRLHVGSAASGTAHTADAVQRGSATRRGSSRTARAWRTIAPSTCRWAASSQSACRPGRSRRSSTGHDTASDLARSPPRRLRGGKGRHEGRCKLASWAGVRGMRIQQARARGMGHGKCKQLDDV